MEANGRQSFEQGAGYTRAQIHEMLGGGKRAFLLTKGGRIVGVCVTRAMNPAAPDVILVGAQADVVARARGLATSGAAVPLFIKRGPKDWEYVGDRRVRSWSEDGAEVRTLAERAGREDVALALFMEPSLPCP